MISTNPANHLVTTELSITLVLNSEFLRRIVISIPPSLSDIYLTPVIGEASLPKDVS